MTTVLRGSDNFDSAKLIGKGQTWQDVLASRAVATDYTNNTGKPIFVSVGIEAAGADNAPTRAQLLVDGVTVMDFGMSVSGTNREYGAASAVVPAGSVYRLNWIVVGTLYTWAELR